MGETVNHEEVYWNHVVKYPVKRSTEVSRIILLSLLSCAPSLFLGSLDLQLLQFSIKMGTLQTDIFGNAFGGTSVASPAMAGIMALVEQVKGAPLGNPAPRMYQLAKLQFNDPITLARCNSSLGTKMSTACVFNNVTAGDNAEPCVKGSVDCHVTAAATMGVGVLRSPTTESHSNAWPAHPGYSLATGLGTVNATNLLYNY